MMDALSTAPPSPELGLWRWLLRTIASASAVAVAFWRVAVVARRGQLAGWLAWQALAVAVTWIALDVGTGVG